jgi:hypothetical protein
MQRRINTAARRDEPLIRDEAQVSVSASTAAGEATKEKDGSTAKSHGRGFSPEMNGRRPSRTETNL